MTVPDMVAMAAGLAIGWGGSWAILILIIKVLTFALKRGKVVTND